MKTRMIDWTRKGIWLVITFAAALSVSNPDISWYPVEMTVGEGAVVQRPVARMQSLPKADEGPVAQLKAQFASDDLADQNPFSNLSSEVPLEALYSAGVQGFERQSLRSGSYRDESGYDLLHYEISLRGGGKAYVLAYVDEGLEELVDDPSPAQNTVVLQIFRPSGEGMELALYRDGALLETSTLSTAKAESLMAQRLNNGVPFLSVAR